VVQSSLLEVEMKVRDGFVSNSSSSSFVCVGVRFKAEESTQYNEDDIGDFCDLVEEVGAWFDGEDSEGWVYYGAFETQDDEDWDTKRSKSFDAFIAEGNVLERSSMTEFVKEKFSLGDGSKVEFGMWTGRTPT
jgi:hypothetical protein